MTISIIKLTLKERLYLEEIQIKIYAKVKEIQEEGEITVSARKMSELCRSLPDKEDLEFNLNNGKFLIFIYSEYPRFLAINKYLFLFILAFVSVLI